MAVRKPTPAETRDRRFGRKIAKIVAREREKAFAEGANAAWRASQNLRLEALETLAADPGSKWSSAYVRRLAILERCDEVLALHRAEAVAKAEGRRGTVEPALVRGPL